MRAAEAALSGSTKANTGDDLTRRMEIWAHEHAPAGSAHTEHAGAEPARLTGAESAHLTGAESAHHAHADDLHGQGAGIVRSAKGAIKTGATMAK